MPKYYMIICFLLFKSGVKTTQTATWSHTVATDGVLVVQSRNTTNANRPVSSITYNSANLSKAVFIQDDEKSNILFVRCKVYNKQP